MLRPVSCVAVQPGAGRVLGLFSVAALPRRLALDFKDLTEKGLAFDSVQGDFELRDGNAFTSNLLLRGPAAEIGIAGRTGLATRDYDQTAVVTGNLGASLPVAGALAGGPAVGAALLLFSQVFKEPLKGITRGYYRITGPWDNPTVERVDASAIKVSEQQGSEYGKVMTMSVAAVIQMTSSPDVAANLATARGLLERARAQGAVLAALPENFAIMGRNEADKVDGGRARRRGADPGVPGPLRARAGDVDRRRHDPDPR